MAFWCCPPLHECYRKIPLKECWGFLKQNVWGSVSVSLSQSEWRLKQECSGSEDVFVALVKLTLETISVTFRNSIFVPPLQFSLLYLPFFFFPLFIWLLLTFVPSLPCSLPVCAALRLHPLEGDRHLSLAAGSRRCPAAEARPRPRPAGGPRRESSGCNSQTCCLSRAVLAVFSIKLCKKQEVVDGTVILGGTEKMFPSLGLADQNPGGFWFACLGIFVWNPVEIWNASIATHFWFILLCSYQEQRLA